MREDHYWPDWDSDTFRTDHVLGQPTEILPANPEDGFVGELLDGDRGPTETSRAKRVIGKILMVVGGVLILGVILYTADLMSSAGDVPRGVVVAGVDVGGMSRADAETKLRRELEPRLTEPIPVDAGDVETTLDPVRSGLSLDWSSTLAQAGHQPLDPLDRIRSFFTKRQVDVVTRTDPDALTQAVTALATGQLDHPPTEGSIGFTPIAGTDGGVTAHAIEPRAGQTMSDVPAAVELIKTRWLDKTGVRLPVATTPVKATSAGVHAALDNLVNPAVANPVNVHGNGADTVLKPSMIAGAMQFTAQDSGGLEVRLDPAKLRQSLQTPLASTETPGQDARIVFAGDTPTVQPSQDARKIDWSNTFKPLLALLAQPSGRDLTVQYQTSKPKLSTDDANALGVKEIVGQFSTGDLSGPAADNAQTLAARINGVLLKPGETFSLASYANGFAGFSPAPANEDGTGPVVRGGGASQLATTLYNAAYFAGLADAGHTAHSHYLDRYPAGRDAIALHDDGSPADLKFTDSLNSGVAIQAYSSGSTVTVRLWGTKQFRVESGTGPRTGITPPSFQPSPPGCTPSPGQWGFDTTDTRVVYDLASGAEVRRDSTTVHYDPQPIVFC
ncbi:vanomycin resistance protein VanB [Amycolatopsis acidicola]|uniref:Vanomycin resistance protein VanB n=1 Tax=Amycolatopsis acidicola TaxID=2596893 RepID=A0A5N0V9C8_9PSEU|nr:VanW family protein [Amycolatopsis acidicola]KAA9161142.1 vanomycin resistance protein VanB [Amycolatopsis acidicola]